MSPSQVPRPLFPFSPTDLERWTRFASKGGIGGARAKVDKVSQDGGQRGLMFLEGEKIVILSDLGAGSFLVRSRFCCSSQSFPTESENIDRDSRSIGLLRRRRRNHLWYGRGDATSEAEEAGHDGSSASTRYRRRSDSGISYGPRTIRW